MLIKNLAITHKCHSSIGNSLDIKIMVHEVLTTLITETLGVYAAFYLKYNNNPTLEFITKAGRMKSFNVTDYNKCNEEFCIINNDGGQRVVVLPLNNSIIFLVYQRDEINLDFLSTLFQGMSKKLNTSIDACLNVEQLRVKNEKLKHFTKMLEHQRTELIQSNKAKDIFLANMSHELKTPLNSIIVISSVMAKNSKNKLDDKQVKNLDIINECGNDLLYIINDILDISKLEAGEITLDLEEIEISKILNEVKDMFEPLMNKKGLEFICEIDTNIDLIISDKNKIKQIIKNLLSNSLKFVDTGKIRLRLEEKNNIIILTVKDDGIGIPEDKLEHIFNRFKQVDESTSRKFGGSGLGLAICKELSYLLGGDIQAHSRVNKGSSFILSIPRYINKDDIIKNNTNTIIKTSKNLKKQNLNKEKENNNFRNILAISDDYLSLFTTFVSLKKDGINTKQLSTVKDATVELESGHFTILILKINNINNEEIILLNKAKLLGIKTIIITDEVSSFENADVVLKKDEIQNRLINEIKSKE